MASRKSIDEHIADKEKKIKQLEAQKQLLEARAKEQERKARTRRLIQIGAIMDKIGCKTTEQAEAFRQEVETKPKLAAYLKSVFEMAAKTK